MSLALVGTSLANAYFSDLAIAYGARSTFFESSEIGGAWGQAPLGSMMAPRVNNILFPYSEDQEKDVDALLEWLAGRGANVHLLHSGFFSTSAYLPEKIVAGNFAPAIQAVVESSSSTVSTNLVQRIEVLPSNVLVNGEAFDYAVLPLNASIELITIVTKFGEKPRTLNLSWVESRSEHVRLLFGTSITAPAFSENRDNVFDRFGVLPPANKIFVGRVGKNWKGKPLQDLIEKSFFTQGLVDRVLVADKQFFSQTRLEPSDASSLKLLSAGTRLIILESSDAITASRQAKDLMKQISEREVGDTRQGLP